MWHFFFESTWALQVPGLTNPWEKTTKKNAPRIKSGTFETGAVK
jgi:hypothetical protein